jgi:hypothetical protein
MHLPRLLTLLAWSSIIGLAAVTWDYPGLRSMARPSSTWTSALSLLEVSLTALLWLAVIVAGVVGVRRWSRDPVAVRIETAILVLASLSFVGTTAFPIAMSFGSMVPLFIPWIPLNIPETSTLASAFCVAALIAILLQSDQSISFEALVAPTVALLFPLALTGVWSGASTATSVTLWAAAASTLVLGLAFALTRDQLHVGLLAGTIGLPMILLPEVALVAVQLGTAALCVPQTRTRAQAAFATGADRIALLGAGLVLAACFGGALLIMMSPTLRSQMERADVVLAMRPLATILAACMIVFALCVLTSPLFAFSLLAATFVVPFVGTWAYEAQCSVIGGSVPIAIAATLARAEWQRSGLESPSRRINLVAVTVLLVIGCVCAAIPHPPTFNI